MPKKKMTRNLSCWLKHVVSTVTNQGKRVENHATKNEIAKVVEMYRARKEDPSERVTGTFLSHDLPLREWDSLSVSRKSD